MAAHREPEGSLLAAAYCCFGSAMPDIVLNIFDEASVRWCLSVLTHVSFDQGASVS